jgi:hypothetical protein
MEGGAIITWQHFRTAGTADIHAQRINSTGDLQWGKIGDFNGTIICNNIDDAQEFPQITSDLNGGAIITWRDKRNLDNMDIYAQRINSTGVLQWGVIGDYNGTIICNEAYDQGGTLSNPREFSIFSDLYGGAIIAWRDNRDDPDGDIYAQRIDLNGQTLWTDNGTAIVNKLYEQMVPQLCSDQNGGAIITWEDRRMGDDDIYAQKINANGQSQWTDNGTLICNAGGMSDDQNAPQICMSGTGGAIITWDDEREDSSGDIYAQLISSNGKTQWKDNGTLICNYDGTMEDGQRNSQLCSDLNGGAVIL